MNELDPKKSIVPIVNASETDPIKEILGTGSFIRCGDETYILTAKHVFEGTERKANEKFAFVLANEKGVDVCSIKNIVICTDYDIAFCLVPSVDGTVPLPFSKQKPALNADVFCYEFSRTTFGRNRVGGKHVSFEPLTHKGNIMRYYESDFPETKRTPCFNTSFPALQGASGAPVISSTINKEFYIAGIMVANQESLIMPAQVVEILDGDDYLERTSYFLPIGKAIDASLITQIAESYKIHIEYAE